MDPSDPRQSHFMSFPFVCSHTCCDFEDTFVTGGFYYSPLYPVSAFHFIHHKFSKYRLSVRNMQNSGDKEQRDVALSFQRLAI